MTRDITARITTIAIPMPFQFRGGPSELPRSWRTYTHTYTQRAMDVSTHEKADVSTAPFAQPNRISSPSFCDTRPYWFTLIFQHTKILHIRGKGLIAAAIVAAWSFFFTTGSFHLWLMGPVVPLKWQTTKTSQVCVFPAQVFVQPLYAIRGDLIKWLGISISHN